MKPKIKIMSNFQLYAVLICCCFNISAAAPYQELLPRPGYIPVYIREGDTPLEDINPQLAEAFHEIETSNLMLEEIASSPYMIRKTAYKDGVLVFENDQLMNGAKQTESTAETQQGSKKEKSSGQNAELAADVVEATKLSKESDIASFDVIKTSDDSAARFHSKVAVDGEIDVST